MRLRDRLPATLALWSVGLAMALSASAGPAPAAEPAYRYRALIEVQHPGAFVQLPLPASIYGHAQQPGLADLRIVDARGERVPFAFLPPPAQPTPAARDATLYALPRQRTASGDWALPVTVQVQGREIRVVTPTGTPVNPPAPAQPPGWLIDLGAPHAEASAASSTVQPQPRALVLAWSGPADFSAGYDLQTSADLRHWAGADSGQLMALTAPTGPLTQPQVPLPAEPARFVRLLWHDPATAPQLTAARVVFAPLAAPGTAVPQATTPPAVAQDAPTWLAFPASPPPQDAVASPPQAIHFDLGGPVPITLVALDTGPGTRILPLQIDGRAAAGQPWQPLVQGVAYRLERDGQVSQSPPLAITTALRYLRVVPDERAAAPPRDALRLRVQTHLPRLVLPTQGQPPYTLLAGAPQAPPGALPASVLVPALQDERPRLGQATLGPWTEEPTVARNIAAWRPWVLWGVLLAGVAGLGVMVWRLRRGV